MPIHERMAKFIVLVLASLAFVDAGKFHTGLAPCRKFNKVYLKVGSLKLNVKIFN